MTAVTAPPPALQTYLRRATAGLPAARRQEVWDELEEHVSCRAEQLEWRGAAPEQALAQALAELGPPLRVSAGMNGVHNMPKLIAFGGIAALVLSASLYALAQQPGPTLQVPVQTSAPRQTCVKSTAAQPDLPLVVKTERVNCYQDASVSQQGIYISFSEMSKALQPLGIRAEVAKGGAIEFHYGPLGGRLVGELYPIFKRGDEPYLSLVDLLQMTMSGFPVPVKV